VLTAALQKVSICYDHFEEQLRGISNPSLGRRVSWSFMIPMSTEPATLDVVQIHPATELDMEAVATVLRDAFLEFKPSYTQAAYAETTPDADTLRRRLHEGPIWVARLRGKIVGTISAVEKPNGIYVRSTAVLPSARGNRIARTLLEEVESFAISCRAEQLFLSTTPFLHAAIRLYEDLGFRRTSEPPHDLFNTPLFTMEKKVVHDRASIPSEELLICDTKREELGRICAMEQGEARNFIIPYPLDRHEAEFAKPDVVYKSISRGGQHIGFLILVLDSDARSVELRRIVVTESGRGYGKRVVSMIDDICRDEFGRVRVWLDVFETNERARHLYEQCGYRRFGESEHEGRSLLLYEKAV
jgi:ribosomal protein S18 acetylase RimI-like enzyme